MPWRRATFKDQKVWVEVDPGGAMVVDGGRARIRYQAKAGAKVYLGAAGRVALEPGAAPEALPDVAAPAPDAPAPSGRAKATPKAGTPGGFGKAGTRSAEQAALAKDLARRLIEGLRADALLCFTDGAAKGNPGRAGSGAVVCWPDGRRAEASRALGVTTNNVAELTAVALALELLDQAGVEPAAKVAIFTDSAYASGVLWRGFKVNANRALVEGIKQKLALRPNVELHWIAGHVGVDENERADALANLGAEGKSHARLDA